MVNNDALSHSETILATVSPYVTYHYGDQISLEGSLASPQNFSNDLGKSFDYISYLRKDGIYFEMKDPEVEIVSSGHGSMIKRNLLAFKGNILEKISRFIHQPESSLLGGLLLGTKQSLGAGIKDAFVKTGTIHIVALSGYNVTIVAEWIMKIFGMIFATTLATGAGIIAIIFFAIMTGGGSTVLRASIMAILVLIARATGRNYEIGRALLLAAVAMIAINPWTLAYDVSFQLSFLATVGLIYLAPKIKHWFHKLPEQYGIQDLINSTVATNIFVMPFIVYQMGIFSIVALPANFLILPIIPLTMLFGFLTLVVGSIVPILGQIVGIAAFVLLAYELAVIRFFGNLSFSSISIAHFPFAIVIILYVFLLYWMFKPDNNKSPL
jgi:competence protein ComEC